jgi:CopG family nickel-responsive transcriptional regulator
MSKLIRFGVSIEEDLLSQFDKLIKNKEYSNRSEAIRDLIRNSIVQELWIKGNEEVVGTITIIYDHTFSGLSNIITDIEHKFHKLIISTAHVHFDEKNCLEVVIVRGEAFRINELYTKLLTLKGVKHAKLSGTGII